MGKALGFEAAFIEKLARRPGAGNEVEAFPSYSAPAAPIPRCPRYGAARPSSASFRNPLSQHVGAL